MYTLDQQIKDLDEAIDMTNLKQLTGDNPYLCHTAKKISNEFYQFIIRSFLRMKIISPKSYNTSIFNPSDFVEYQGVSPSIWGFSDFDSRLQFLHDLKEDIIENG